MDFNIDVEANAALQAYCKADVELTQAVTEEQTNRHLATIRRITAIEPIPKADRICVYVVDGWKVVDAVGKYQVGELVVYLEVDSWVPHALAPFLTKPGHTPKVYNGVEGQRLKTIKLRGQLSQGLILPVHKDTTGTYLMIQADDTLEYSLSVEEGADVTKELGIKKWEKEIPACLAGVMKGNFPSAIPKTDQERIQNLTKRFEEFKEHIWFVTEKLDGSSCTFYLDAEGEFHVCSRNIDLVQDEANSFWQAAIKYDIENIMRKEELFGVAIQGELIGPGIQGNQYERTELEFYAFGMYNAGWVEGERVGHGWADMAYEYLKQLGIPHVPVLDYRCVLSNGETIAGLLKYASAKSQLNDSEREGVVFCSLSDPNVSFKAISDTWNLQNDAKDD